MKRGTAPLVREEPGREVVGRGAAQLMVARCVFLASGVLISIILARHLEPSAFGIYGVVMSVLTWVQFILGAGASGATVQLMSRHPDQGRVIEQTTCLLFATKSLALFFVSWIAAPSLAALLAVPNGTVLLRVASLDIPLMAFFSAYQGILYARGSLGGISWCLIIYSVTKLAGVLALLGLGVSVLGALIAHVLATVSVLAYLLIKFPPDRTPPSRAVAGQMVWIALPFAAYTVAYQVLTNVSLWLLQAFETASGASTGYFVAALNIVRSLTIVQSALGGVLLVTMSQALARGDEDGARRLLQDAVRYALLVLAPACVLLLDDADRIIELLYTADYGPGAVLLHYQVIGFVALSVLDVLFMAILAAGRLALPTAVVTSLVPVAVALNVMLIPSSGGVGAAQALLITAVGGASVAALIAWRRFGGFLRLVTTLRVGMAGGLIALLSSQIPVDGLWLLPKFVMLLGVYGVVLALLGELQREDLRSLAVWRRSQT